MKATEWAKTRWARFRKDVWDDPSIGPFAGILLSILASLIIWLTVVYAPEAVLRGEQSTSAVKEAGQGVIKPFWGKTTIIFMTIATLIVGFEPIVSHEVERWWRRTGKRWWQGLPTYVRWCLFSPLTFVIVPAKSASFVWSLADTLLARPGAIIAGAAWRGWMKRYTHFIVVMTLSVCATIAVDATLLSAELGLAAIVAGLLAILSVVRRWSWIERDRATFLIERGERSDDQRIQDARKPDTQAFRGQAALSIGCFLLIAVIGIGATLLPQPWLSIQSIIWVLAPLELLLFGISCLSLFNIWIDPGPSAIRIGFKEDLRDEALFALACLFFLIPLGLSLVQQTTSAAGAPAFAFDDDSSTQSGALARFITWLGYFGAELAKTVPFVDWSEVFHVANGSPIKTQTALGSQLAFLLRAGLDLVFLAAVLQAVQIAGRLREQESAFKSNRLPILEPFTEKVALVRAFELINEDLDLRPSAQDAILNFPRYDPARLKELISGTAATKDPSVRKAAAVLLQKDYEAAPDSNPDTPYFWTDRTKVETDATYRTWLLNVASGADRDEPSRMKDTARRARLLRLIEEDWHDPFVRSQAVRQLGRSGLSAPERSALVACLTLDQDLTVQASAAVALAKAQATEAFPLIEALAARTPETAVVPSQALAFALSHRGEPVEEIASRFGKVLRPHALTAALIQRTPMETESGKTEKFTALCQTVALTPGQGPFPDHFFMGSSQDDSDAFDLEHPQRRVTMTQPFAIGRFPVTMTEYSAFSDALGRPRLQYAANTTWPAIEVSWFDAQAFCRWLGAITGESWRLPTEAEWEYACRAGTTSAYSWGPDWDVSKANSNQTQPNDLRDVDGYPPNNWGIWDMQGNALEWCLDPWHQDYSNAPVDGVTWLQKGDFSMRAARGGSWRNFPQQLRSAVRYRNSPTVRYTNFGFRLARTLE